MEKKISTKSILLGLSLFMIITLSIAFAALAIRLKVEGSGKTDPANWDIHFTNLSSPIITGGASVVNAPQLANQGASITNLEVNLKLPGDSVTYTVDIVNTGDINAKISNIQKEIDCEEMSNEDLSEIFEFSVYYTDTNNQLQLNDELLPEDKKNVTIKIKYKDIEDPDLLPDEALTIDLSYSITYEQSNLSAYNESGLPRNYTQLEYLESNGTQYIDTGVLMDSSTNIYISYFQRTSSVAWQNYLGVTDGSNNQVLLMQYNSNSRFEYNIDGSYGYVDDNSIFSLKIENNRFTTIDLSNNNVFSTTLSKNISSKTNSLYLFANNNKGIAGNKSSIRLGIVKFIKNGEIIKELIPALDSSGRPCMYDTVTKQAFYNQGTGEFLYDIPIYLPSGYTELDYLESTGLQYIDTGVLMDSSTNIYVSYFQRTSSVAWQNYLGVTDGSNNQVLLMQHSANSRFEYNIDGSYGYVNDNSIFSLKIENNRFTTIDLSNNNVSSTTVTKNISSKTNSLYLFAYNNKGNAGQKSNCRLGIVKFTKNGDIIKELVPALDSSGRPCMYDTVSKQAFYNQGTGEFLYPTE